MPLIDSVKSLKPSCQSRYSASSTVPKAKGATEVTVTSAPDAVDAADPLFEECRCPGQIDVDNGVGDLEVAPSPPVSSNRST